MNVAVDMPLEQIMKQAAEESHVIGATVAWLIPNSERDRIIVEMEQAPEGYSLAEFMAERGFTPVWGQGWHIPREELPA